MEGVDALRGGLAVHLGMEIATPFGASLGGFDREGMGLRVRVLADGREMPVHLLPGRPTGDGEAVVP